MASEVLSKITLTFTGTPSDGEFVDFERYDGVTAIANLETFQTGARTQYGQIPIPTGSPTTSDIAETYVKYFTLDYNSSGVYTIGRVANVVTIETSSIFQFQNDTTDLPLTKIVDVGVPQSFTLDDTTIDDAVASNLCNTFSIRFETSENITELYENGVLIVAPNSSDFTYDFPRATVLRFQLKNSAGDSVWFPAAPYEAIYGQPNYIYIRKLIEGNMTVDVTPNTLTGATVILGMTFPNQLSNSTASPSITYSIDGTNYFVKPTFTSQANGTGLTAYIKDSFGCIVTKTYEVTDSGTRDPYFKISDVNSVTFSKSETWDGYDINKNDINTLSSSSLAKTVYCEQLLYQTNDVITIQFKTNFTSVTAGLGEYNDVGQTLTVEKKSNNLGRFESLDGTVYNKGNGQMGIYFDSGNTYDEFQIPNGSYTLNGNLPNFAIKGQFIEVKFVGVFEVKDVIFDAEKNRQAIIVDWEYLGADVDYIILSTFDLLPYEVYEFDVDFSTRVVGEKYLTITASDSQYDSVAYFSENILIADEHPNTLHIRYWNDNNRDIFYIYGITHFIRIPYLKIEALLDDNVENIVGDLTSSISQSTVKDGNTIDFDALTRRAYYKLALALSSANLFINDEGYIKKDSLGIKQIENTNLIEVTASLLKTNENFNINLQQQTGGDYDSVNPLYPKVVTGDTGLIKIK